MSERIACVVPFCRRTASRERFPDAAEIICRKHARAVSERLRKAYRAQLKLETSGKSLSSKQIARGWRLWDRFKAAAISAAGAAI